MIPWTDQVSTEALKGYSGSDPAVIAYYKSYKGNVQFYWAIGAIVGSFMGAQVAVWFGRRWSYFFISLAAVTLTWTMFQQTAPLEKSFLAIVAAQGFASTLYFGWLPMYLPELFPTRTRASGMGLSYNVGRFATALGVLAAGWLLKEVFGNSMAKTGAFCGLVYALGLVIIWFAPNTAGKSLDADS